MGRRRAFKYRTFQRPLPGLMEKLRVMEGKPEEKCFCYHRNRKRRLGNLDRKIQHVERRPGAGAGADLGKPRNPCAKCCSSGHKAALLLARFLSLRWRGPQELTAVRNPDNQATTMLHLGHSQSLPWRRSLPRSRRTSCPTIFEIVFLQVRWVPLASDSQRKILVKVKFPGSNHRTY